MISTTRLRAVAIGFFMAIGSFAAFSVGARVGAEIDHGTRSVSIARVPVSAFERHTPDAPAAAPPAESEVARKE